MVESSQEAVTFCWEDGNGCDVGKKEKVLLSWKDGRLVTLFSTQHQE